MLEYLVFYGEELKIGKRIVGYGLNESDFKNKIKFKKTFENIANDEFVSNIIPDKRIELSRGKFLRQSEELLLSKLIIQVKAKNKRGNCYSITPLGICYLLISNPFDLSKMTPTITDKILKIFKLFAIKNVPHYESKILSSIKLDFKTIDEVLFPSPEKIKIKTMNKIQKFKIQSNLSIPILRTVLSYEEDYEFIIRFYLNNNYLIKYPIIQLENYKSIVDKKTGKTIPTTITVTELGKLESFDIDEMQFHNYMSKIIICLIIFYHGLLSYNLQLNDKKNINNGFIYNSKISKLHLEVIFSIQNHLQNILTTEDQYMYDFRKYLHLKLQNPS